MDRVAAFMKRLASISLHLPVKAQMPLLSLLKQLLIVSFAIKMNNLLEIPGIREID